MQLVVEGDSVYSISYVGSNQIKQYYCALADYEPPEPEPAPIPEPKPERKAINVIYEEPKPADKPVIFSFWAKYVLFKESEGIDRVFILGKIENKFGLAKRQEIEAELDQEGG